MFITNMSTPQNQAFSFKPNKKDNSAISHENFKNSSEQAAKHKFPKEMDEGRPMKPKQGKKREVGFKQSTER